MSKSKTLRSRQVIEQKARRLNQRSKSKIHNSKSQSQCRQKRWLQDRSDLRARGTSFSTRPRDAFQLCTLDQNRLRPPITTQKLTGCIRLDERHSLAIGPAIQTEPTRLLVWNLPFIFQKQLREIWFWRHFRQEISLHFNPTMFSFHSLRSFQNHCKAP